MAWLPVSEAAERLGVSSRQVQHLVAQGSVRQLARGVVDETSVELLLAVRGDSHRRAWSEATAWAAIALLSGAPCEWLGPSQRSRLGARLRTYSATGLVAQTRMRADVTRYVGHPSTTQRLRSELIDTTTAATALGLTAGNAADGYLAKTALEDTVKRHGLIRNDEGQVTLRATTMDLSIISNIAKASPVLAALDLAESLDSRARRVGLDNLDDALESFRG
jgi:hypothetical protein